MKTGIGSGIGNGILLASSIVFLSQPGTALAQSDRSMFLEQYKGMPFQDSHYKTVPQGIPGRVECAAYDVGGESVAYHDSDAVNHGSGEYARGETTTNTVEGFFGIFKRGMVGVYHHCGEDHLQAYLSRVRFPIFKPRGARG